MQGAGAPVNNMVLVPTPGLRDFALLAGASVDVLYEEPVTERGFAVSGGVFYELFADGTSKSYGAVAPGPYEFSSLSSKQVMLSAAGTSAGYIFDLTANTLTLITASGFKGTTRCSSIDDYLISLVPNSREFQISALLDGTQWDGLDFGAASGGPDNIITFKSSHRELWLASKRRVEIYVDDGSANFPFDRLGGAYLETGCAAARTFVRIDNTLFWLGQDERGAGMVWRASGYTPQRISNHSVEWFITEYGKHGGLTDAFAYAYQENGHTFYVLTFPSATGEPNAQGGMTLGVRQGATWVYDVATGQWHERAYWNAAKGQWQAHLGCCHAYLFGKHLVGDYQSGHIYEMSSDYNDDAGAVIRRVRRAPDINREGRLTFYPKLELAMQVGAGNVDDPNPQGILRYSNDGGYTWGKEIPRSLGKIGQYKKRVAWNALGSARQRAFEFSTTARVPVTLTDAFLSTTTGSA
jgi:hypothetical protein